MAKPRQVTVQQETFILEHYDSQTGQEIAEALGKPLWWVKGVLKTLRAEGRLGVKTSGFKAGSESAQRLAEKLARCAHHRLCGERAIYGRWPGALGDFTWPEEYEPQACIKCGDLIAVLFEDTGAPQSSGQLATKLPSVLRLGKLPVAAAEVVAVPNGANGHGAATEPRVGEGTIPFKLWPVQADAERVAAVGGESEAATTETGGEIMAGMRLNGIEERADELEVGTTAEGVVMGWNEHLWQQQQATHPQEREEPGEPRWPRQVELVDALQRNVTLHEELLRMMNLRTEWEADRYHLQAELEKTRHELQFYRLREEIALLKVENAELRARLAVAGLPAE